MKWKWIKSLQFKYLMIIFLAMAILPISVPFISMLVYIPALVVEDPAKKSSFSGSIDLEEMWHKQAKSLSEENEDEIRDRLQSIQKKHPEAQLFWVDSDGITRDTYSVEDTLPEKWSSSYTIQFMKNAYDADPFTVVAFFENNPNNGFMVIKVDRILLEPPIQRLGDHYTYIFIVVNILILLLFIFLSWLFFKSIHKRLLRLSHAMENKGANGIPQTVIVSKTDEIGQLEDSFNRMIQELEQSNQREQKQEELRKNLIANLSHDLRTPLTTIRAQLDHVKDEVKTIKGKEALASIDQKIDYLGSLIDNLLSYTLLSAKKYPFHPEKTELNRFIRKITAQWYPVLEEKKFDITINTNPEQIFWNIDPQWMERIFDNLLQNVVRHAAEGKFLEISLISEENLEKLVITDKGKGFNEKSEKQGARIGLTIVDVMIKEMNLTWSIETGDQGTTITIEHHKKV
ncbi:signal transduction histidine kinase [Metabacillus crassostreae]|uniref:sensor histidine kinase n=1 Tax=Metabacillus crassostreae TaxID=929098 RepID=UPI00195DC63D|nr:HAMP domain-containing sensor histidine kinase [Metabacillus crassostreae]MBM7606347.1 signal transduction histidine kinase [Metabacillus crassostreae]